MCGTPPHTHIRQARLTLDLPCSCTQSNHAPFLPQVHRPTKQWVAWSSWLPGLPGGLLGREIESRGSVCLCHLLSCPVCDVSPTQPLPSLPLFPHPSSLRPRGARLSASQSFYVRSVTLSLCWLFWVVRAWGNPTGLGRGQHRLGRSSACSLSSGHPGPRRH